MSTTDVLADPITSTLASVLTVPLRQLYALLWRAGVVEIVET
ncbi:MAG TPA: Rv1535 domain-containing protein, partial [Mycobacterium sp.]|nr:Rv1535 domain-containing protein [Mycobacterium sp.]